MSAFPGSPRILKGGIVLIDADSSAVQRVIALQYNPDSLTRSLQVQAVSADGGDRSEVLRLKGPPVETLKLEAEIDATDQLEFPEQNSGATSSGIFVQLAALETMVYPTSGQLQANDLMAQFVQMGARYVSTGTDLAFLIGACNARAKFVKEINA